MADFGGDTELEAFRAEARAWLEANFPASLRGKGMMMLAESEGGKAEGDIALWRQRIADKGWGTPT